MKKSGEFWLKCLSDDIREKWLKNYDPDFSSYKDYAIPLNDYLKKDMSFKDFIEHGFRWDKTPEGDPYWLNIFRIDEDKLIQHQRNHKLKQLGLLQKQSGTL